MALDVAASEFFSDGKYRLASENKVLSAEEMIDYYEDLVYKYSILSIEDGLGWLDPG